MPKTDLAKPVSFQDSAPAAARERVGEVRTTRRLGAGRLVIAALIQIALVAAIAVAGWQMRGMILETAPKAERGKRERAARLVEVAEVEAATRGPVIEAWGEVVPAQTLIVRPEISGTVVWVHPDVTPGGRLTAGQSVARFDDRDLRLALAQAEADVAEIDARIQIERGQGELGKRELKRLSRNITAAQRALVLREPQMAQLRAEMEAAQAQVAQAKNALAKADVKTPFDAIVTAEAVATGSMIAQGAETATLVASDRFHVTLAVPASALAWLRFDGTQQVTLTQPGIWGPGQRRTGTIVRLGAGLTETGRMVEVIVSVPKPLETGDQPVLLLESFVRAQIETPVMPDTLVLDRAHLRDDDTVWVMQDDATLAVRKVDVAWRGAETVLIRSGLEAGERVVTTYLATFAPGMTLRTEGNAPGSGA